MADTETKKVAQCSFFYGTISEVKLNGQGVTVSNGHEEFFLSSQNDPGLPFLVVGKRRMVVIVNNKVIAIYIRPRIPLINRLASGVLVSKENLLSYRPIYPINYMFS